MAALPESDYDSDVSEHKKDNETRRKALLLGNPRAGRSLTSIANPGYHGDEDDEEEGERATLVTRTPAYDSDEEDSATPGNLSSKAGIILVKQV
jgi:hypothetical protein